MPANGAGPPPDEIKISRDGRRLTLSWGNGGTACLSALTLRQSCKCAWCTRDRIGSRFAIEEDQAVADARVLGSHGLHLTFADGHARGIFPWAYLRDLAEAATDTSPALAGPSHMNADARLDRMEHLS